MANVWYDKGVEKFASAQVNWGTGSGGDTIKVVGVDTASYTFSQSHEFLSDIAVGARIVTSPAFTGKTLTAGTLDADDIPTMGPGTGSVKALVVYKDTGSAATSPLLFYVDSVTGIPITLSSSSASVTWNNGSGKIAVL